MEIEALEARAAFSSRSRFSEETDGFSSQIFEALCYWGIELYRVAKRAIQ